MGAPSAPSDGLMHFELRNSSICFWSSVRSTPSRGNNFLFGGAAESSIKGILCSNCTGQSERSTGYVGSSNTRGYRAFKYSTYSFESYSISPCATSASSVPSCAARWVKLSYYCCIYFNNNSSWNIFAKGLAYNTPSLTTYYKSPDYH